MSVPSVGTVIVHIPSGAARIPKKASMFVFGAARAARMLFTKVMTGYVRFGNQNRKENNMGFFYLRNTARRLNRRRYDVFNLHGEG